MADYNRHLTEECLSDSKITSGIELIIAIGKRVRNSVLDYALGAAILGLIPVYGRWIPEIRFALLTILNLKMVVNIGRFWGYHKNQDILVIVGSILGLLASFTLAMMTWLIIFAIGLFVPLVDSLARACAYGIFTWSIGHTISRYYYSPQNLDTKALQRAFQFMRSQQQRRRRK
ncbi:MAG: hypothetical protein AAGF83_06425 [Cyanobacteria bacterium P01_G01_bin.67]